MFPDNDSRATGEKVVQSVYTWNPLDPDRLVLVVGNRDRLVLVVGNRDWYCIAADRSRSVEHDLGALVDSLMVPVLAPEEVPARPAGAGKKWRFDGSPKKRRFGGR
jgi:hypothetical protein